jgi:hypothetical protein
MNCWVACVFRNDVIASRLAHFMTGASRLTLMLFTCRTLRNALLERAEKGPWRFADALHQVVGWTGFEPFAFYRGNLKEPLLSEICLGGCLQLIFPCRPPDEVLRRKYACCYRCAKIRNNILPSWLVYDRSVNFRIRIESDLQDALRHQLSSKYVVNAGMMRLIHQYAHEHALFWMLGVCKTAALQFEMHMTVIETNKYNEALRAFIEKGVERISKQVDEQTVVPKKLKF